jgi:rare lipoprotein A
MEYKVQRGDTIAQISKLMGNNWRTLKQLNPQAVGHSRVNGNWFFREGTTLSDQPKKDFAALLGTATTPKTGGKNTATTAVGRQEQATAATSGQERTHTVKAGETIWDLAVNTYHVNPDDLLKANNITDPRSLQIGRTLRIPDGTAQVAAEQVAAADQEVTDDKTEVVASWYGSYHHGLTMANGKPFDMFANTIAHKDIPLGTKVSLENPDTGEKVTATVTDRGPYVKGRDVDLSYKLAQSLSLDKQGVGNLILQVL